MTDVSLSANRPDRRGLGFAMRRYIHRRPVMFIGAVVLLLMALISICAPLIASQDPLALDPVARLQPPSAEHLAGTDMHGRDLFARILYGGRISLLVGFSVAALASCIGTLIGLVSGFFRHIDGLLMRIMDALMSIPPIMLAIALMALLEASVQNVIFAITFAEVPRVARLVRSNVLSLRSQLYVEAVVSLGARSPRIIFRHILPNALAPIVVQATFICATAMLIEAALSFIGAGVPPSVPSWGNVLAEGRTLWQIRPEMVFGPALALSITVLAMNLVGDGLSELADPRSKGRH